MTEQEKLLDMAEESRLRNYRPAPFVLARGSGCEVWDISGNRYLDLSAGIAVTSLGHCHPTLSQRIAEQASSLMHVSNLFYNDQAILLGAELAKRTPYDRYYFCNSGAEAVESCLKLARNFHFLNDDTKRTRFVAAEKSFHGRTFGALSVTGQPKYHSGFKPLVGPVDFFEFGNVDSLRSVVNHETAAVIVEPVQAEGGIYPATQDFLLDAASICQDAGALLIFDEVQTGIGRCGSFLASQHYKVRADAISLAKGIGGGFPLGAMLCREQYADALPPGTHASTFGGNPLACAAGRAVLEVFDSEAVLENVRTQADFLAFELKKIASDPDFPSIIEHRGLGLLQGLVLAKNTEPRKLLSSLQESGLLLTLAGGSVLRFSPALTVTPHELQEGIGMLRNVLSDASFC